MKKLMVMAMSCAALAACGDVFEHAVAWYRGAVDANGDGVFADGRGCLRDVLHAADSSYFTHGATLAGASAGPIYIRRMDVHCPYRNEILKDVPCLYFAQEVVEEYDPVVIGGVTRKVQKIRTNYLNLPNLLKDFATAQFGTAAPCRDYTIVMRFRRDQPVNINNAGTYSMMKAGSVWNTGADRGLWLLMDGNSDTRERWFSYYTGNGINTDMGMGSRTYQEFPKRETSLKIGEGQWVDFALSVKDNYDVTVAYAWDVSGDGTSMTNRLVRWWQMTAANGGGIDSRYRTFTLGGHDGGYTAGAVITNGCRTVNGKDCLGCEKVMRGAIHQFAFWTNCLSQAEILEAFSNGRPSAFKVGIKGKAGQIFTRRSTSVHADDMWEELDTTLTAQNPSATVRFTYYHDEEKGVPQVLRLSAASGSGNGAVRVTVNGRQLVPDADLSITAGETAHAYIPAHCFTTGTNSVTVTRVDAAATPLVLDELELCGGWQMGRSMDDFEHEDYSTNVVGLVTGSWKQYKRGFLTGPGNERNASMYIPHAVAPDMAGLYDAKLTLDLAGVTLNGKNPGFPFVVTMDGEEIWSSDDISGMSSFTVTIPAERLTAGNHMFKFLATAPNAGSWALVDFWKFAYRRDVGMVIILK